MLIAVILFLMRQPFISCISIYSSCHMLVIQFNAFGRKWLHVSILFYCILIDTKDSIKNGETLPIWFGCTENGRRVVFARSRSYLSHSGYRHRRRATMPTHKIYFTSNYVLHFCPRFLNWWRKVRTRKKSAKILSVLSVCVEARFDLDIVKLGSLSVGVVRKRQFTFLLLFLNSANLTRGSNRVTPVAAHI